MLGVLDLGRCAQHRQAAQRGWSVGRCEIKCEIEQVPALRLVGVCYSGIPRRSFCGRRPLKKSSQVHVDATLMQAGRTLPSSSTYQMVSEVTESG